MKQTKHRISEVLPGSIAEELELEAGDCVLAINDQTIDDIFDYEYLAEDGYKALEKVLEPQFKKT